MLCKLLDCPLLLQVLLGTPAGEFLKLASDHNMKPLQRLSGPAVAATLVDNIPGGQGMHACSDSTTNGVASGPEAEASVTHDQPLLDQLPVWQSPCLPERPHPLQLSEGRMKEVRDLMDIFIPGAPEEKATKRAIRLSSLGIETFTGVDPDEVHVVDHCLGIGGYGEVQL